MTRDASVSSQSRPRTIPSAGQMRDATLRVIALSLALAVALETLLVGVAATTGGIHSPTPFVVNLVQKLPWALVVCTGLWLGLEIGRSRPVAVGVAGLVAAPIASLLARSIAEGAHAFAFAGTPAGSALLVAAVKAVEFACLGYAIGWLGERAWAGATHHAVAGLLAGVVFGGSLLALSAVGSPEPSGIGRLMGWAIDELLFPIGCALIVFSVRDLARSASDLGAQET